DARGKDVAKLAVGALGVVYGDIGTSPLYAIRECVTPPHGVVATPENVLGVLSLVFWALTLVVTIKYLRFVMRADNNGEGGVLALLALLHAPLQQTTAQQTTESAQAKTKPRLAHPHRTALLGLLALFGASLLYGDGMITPAISVLSAVEGLGVATLGFVP